jgi:hypothetical protein
MQPLGVPVMVTPLALPNATGSPVNPVAMF